MQQYCTCENNQVTPYWNYAENIKDGRGVTFGFIGFTTGTYDGNILIKHYTTMNPNNVLAKYIPALNVIDNGPTTMTQTMTETMPLPDSITSSMM